jgi:hypothetical protein
MADQAVPVGYMNVHLQRVIARARVRGVGSVHFVMWCLECGHRYVADGGEVLGRRCPNHHCAGPALEADSPRVEWLS